MLSNDPIALLRSASMFVETPPEALTEVAALLQPLMARAGEAIVRKGEPGDCMYLVVAGRLRAYDGERPLDELGPGDVFGEMAVLTAAPRMATIVVVEETRLLRLDRAPFQELLTRRPEVAQGVIHLLAERLRARVNDMAQDFEYMQQMARITTAAARLEAGTYDPRSLDEVARRDDALGQLARVFRHMASEVQLREQRLEQQIQQLRIEVDQTRMARAVAAITGSEYFQQLREQAAPLRKLIEEE